MDEIDLRGAPDWFLRAARDVGESATIEVEGARIHHLAWGSRAAPTLVLVHGGAAHARWWQALAPLLAVHHRVIAIDLSGHGDSDRRDEYHPQQWVREVLAVAEHAGGVGRPVVVGHSMGGFVTIVAAAHHGSSLDGVIVLDVPIRRPDPESDDTRAGRMLRAPKTYPDRATAREHFHLVPPQPCDNTWLVDHVAHHSLREVDGGWTWKFDPAVFVARRGPRIPSDFAADLAHAACRVAICNGARSTIVDQHVRDYMAELLEGSPAGAAGVPFVEVPEAHHHLMLDQPLATVTAIRAVLATWRPVGAPPLAVLPDGEWPP
ncbi:MAG: alpha/beta hydrolase [Nitriliruptoraceae bacterium]